MSAIIISVCVNNFGDAIHVFHFFPNHDCDCVLLPHIPYLFSTVELGQKLDENLMFDFQ